MNLRYIYAYQVNMIPIRCSYSYMYSSHKQISVSYAKHSNKVTMLKFTP